MTRQVGSIAISGRLALNMHSLNNEGGEGNQIFTRQVTIVDGSGKLVSVNAISGDMYKHIQNEHLLQIAREAGLPLCAACSLADPNRIGNDQDFLRKARGLGTDAAIVEAMLETCVADDLEGILITAGNRNTARKSTVEFGWVVGIPELTTTESFFHVKYIQDAGAEHTGIEEGANVGQNIYYRPANSGVYATVVNLETARIGFNDYRHAYAISTEERGKRYQALLRSVLYTYLEPNGAMRNTQNPHILGFSGIISVSAGSIPAPLVSALNPRFDDEIKGIAASLNKLAGKEAVELYSFSTLAEFAKVMAGLIEDTLPYAYE